MSNELSLSQLKERLALATTYEAIVNGQFLDVGLPEVVKNELVEFAKTRLTELLGAAKKPIQGFTDEEVKVLKLLVKHAVSGKPLPEPEEEDEEESVQLTQPKNKKPKKKEKQPKPEQKGAIVQHGAQGVVPMPTGSKAEYEAAMASAAHQQASNAKIMVSFGE